MKASTQRPGVTVSFIDEAHVANVGGFTCKSTGQLLAARGAAALFFSNELGVQVPTRDVAIYPTDDPKFSGVAVHCPLLPESLPRIRPGKKTKQPEPSGLRSNVIILELRDTFERGERPVGIAAAIITNDLKAAFSAIEVDTSVEEIAEAVRYVHTHIPSGKVAEWRRKLGKGGAS